MLDRENELLLDSLPGMAYRCAVEAPWTMHYVSPGVRYVCSYDPEDFTSGKVFWGNLIHPDDMPAIDRELAEAVSQHRQFNFHFRIQDPSGIRWLNEAGQAIYGPDGKPEALVGFIIDVSEHELVQEQLRQAEQRYALAAKATGEIIWDRELDSNEVKRKVPENSAFYDGNQNAANQHDWWESRVHPEDAGLVQQAIQTMLRTGREYWSAEYRFRRPDDTYGHIFDQGFLVSPQIGEQRRMVGAMQDFSERKAAEAQVEQLQAELIHVSQNSAMGAMASTLAHELNQPLAAASNYLTGSKNLVSKELGPMHSAVSGLGEAALQIERAGEIIRRMRALVQNDKSRREDVSLIRLFTRIEKLIVASNICPQLNLQVAIPKEADCVTVDQIQIEQVMLNVLRNACEAMEGLEQQSIFVSASALSLGVVEIQISDQGSGMSESTLASLFTAYGLSTTGGLGVGLSISRTIVEAHGGTIRAENNGDRGVSFYITLPAGD